MQYNKNSVYQHSNSKNCKGVCFPGALEIAMKKKNDGVPQSAPGTKIYPHKFKNAECKMSIMRWCGKGHADKCR